MSWQGKYAKEWRFCDICEKRVSAGQTPWRNHMRRHVKEGVLKEKQHQIIKTALIFTPVEFKWWGVVMNSDRELVTIRSHSAPNPRLTIERFKVGGPIVPGDAVRLEFRKAQPTKVINTDLGGWYAEPLGYKADWISILG